jgi:actin, other eukaryote
MYCGDEVAALVGDIGSSFSKFGYAGEDTPRHVCTSNVGTTSSNTFFVGDDDATYPRPNMSVRNPICNWSDVKSSKNSEIKDWDVVQTIWENVMTKAKLTADRLEHPVMLVEPTLNPISKRVKYLKMMFETFSIPAAYLGQDTVLASYAAGRSSGLVMLFGGGGRQIVPIWDGYALLRSCDMTQSGGRRITTALVDSLRSRKIGVRPMYEIRQPNMVSTLHETYRGFLRHEIARDIKETTFKIAETSVAVDKSSKGSSLYHLPDRTQIDISAESTSLPELILGGKKTGSSIADTVFQVVENCPAETRRSILQNVVVQGGSSLFRGMSQRLSKELERRIPSSHKARLVVPSPHERKFSCWIGGSILSSLGSFQQNWISKAEFEEFGESVVRRRLC